MTIGFLGAGKMAEAILAGVLKAALVDPRAIMACELRADRRAELRKRYRVRVTASARKTLAACDVIVLAVKPQDMNALLAPLAPFWRRRHLALSIAAGKTLDELQAHLGERTCLVRAMPNLPLMVGRGMSVLCAGKTARPADLRVAQRVLGCAGLVTQLPECRFDAVTALSGSGPAFFAFFMQALADAATNEGLPPTEARLLACQTMLGTAHYLLETGQDPRAFMRTVASTKGTTVAGLAVLENSALHAIAIRAIRAAARRSAELSRC